MIRRWVRVLDVFYGIFTERFSQQNVPAARDHDSHKHLSGAVDCPHTLVQTCSLAGFASDIYISACVYTLNYYCPVLCDNMCIRH